MSLSLCRIALYGGTLVLSALVVRTGLSGYVLANGNAATAVAIWPGSGSAQAELAEQSFETGAFSEASAAAIRAIQDSPQQWGALRTLERLADRRGDQAISDTAAVLGARSSWRNSFAQRTLLDKGVVASDWLAVAQTGDALLRAGNDPKPIFEAFRRLLVEPKGREELAVRLSAQPSWAPAFLRAVDFTALSPDDMADFLLQLDQRGVRPSGKGIDGYFRTLIARGNVDQALAISRRINGRSAGDPSRQLVDGDFAQMATGSESWGPFGWRASNDGRANIEVVPRSDRPGEQALTIDLDTARRILTLSQMVALQPGRYALAYQTKTQRGGRKVFVWTLTCLGSNKRLMRAAAVPDGFDEWREQRITFTVQDKCNGQKLELIGGPTEAGGAALSLSAMRIEND